MPAPGRFIRLSLVLFPVGLILTSIASFAFWWQKREQVEERSFAYATALRRELTEASLVRHTRILQEVLSSPGLPALAAVASYLESSMSPENMGYEPRRDRFFHQGQEVSNLEVELTGTQRPREVHLILVPYGTPDGREAEIQALAGMMGLAHAMAGDRRENTLRFAAVPLGVRDSNDLTALSRLSSGIASRQERVVKIFVLGGAGEETLKQVRDAFRVEQSGAVVQTLASTQDPRTTLDLMLSLKSQL